MPLPHTFFTILLILDILVLAVLIPYGHLHHQDPGYFMREGKTITHLSAVQLGAIGLLSLLILKQRWPISGKSSLLWLAIGAGFIFLTVDDLVQFHENLDKWIHHWVGRKPNNITTRLDDVIILLYGIIGAGIMWINRAELKNYRALLPYLVWGFVFLILCVGLDVFTHRTDAIEFLISDAQVYMPILYWLHPLEDIFKILAEGIFLGTFYAAFYQTLKSPRGAVFPAAQQQYSSFRADDRCTEYDRVV